METSIRHAYQIQHNVITACPLAGERPPRHPVWSSFVHTLVLHPTLSLLSSTASAFLYAMGRKKMKPCLCSTCTAPDPETGIKKLGVMLELRQWKQHEGLEALRQDQEDHVYYASLAAAVGDDPRVDTLPTRPRDVAESSGVDALVSYHCPPTAIQR